MKSIYILARLFKLDLLAIITYYNNSWNIKIPKVRLYHVWLAIFLIYIIILLIDFFLILEIKLSSYITIISIKKVLIYEEFLKVYYLSKSTWSIMIYKQYI